MKKKIIRLTESDLHRIVENSVKRVLKEANEPNWTRSAHDNEYEFNNGLERDPYMGRRNTMSDDGYDYCGDDMYNDEASEYNDEMDDLLSTKKGQMDFDWDTIDSDDASRIGPKSSSSERGRYGFGGRNGSAYKDSMDVARGRNIGNEWSDDELMHGERAKRRWLNHK